jgi:hypothetical protein
MATVDELRMVTPRAEAVRREWHLQNTLLDTVRGDRGEITPGEAEAGSLRRELASSASRALPRFRRAVRRYGTCQSQLRLITTPVRSRLTLLGCNAANKMVSIAEDPEVFTSSPSGRRTAAVEILPSTWGRQTSVLRLPQHANEYRTERPILLAVDHKLGEC